MTTLLDVQGFLALHRLVVVGVSRNPHDFTRQLFRELLKLGYDLAPVNPNASEIDGVACYGSVLNVTPPAEGALLLTAPEVTEKIVEDCAKAGIHHVWMYRAVGRGAVNPEASKFCAEHGIHVVAGECPFMFLPDAGWIHRAHGFCKRVFGGYPA
jgi:uncharacterized protein